MELLSECTAGYGSSEELPSTYFMPSQVLRKTPEEGTVTSRTVSTP